MECVQDMQRNHATHESAQCPSSSWGFRSYVGSRCASSARAGKGERFFDASDPFSPWYPAAFTQDAPGGSPRYPQTFSSAGQYVCANVAYAEQDMCTYRNIMLDVPLHDYPRSEDEDLLCKAALSRFKCDPMARRMLLETDDMQLYFADVDAIWGVGMGKGKNLWGTALMRARDWFKQIDGDVSGRGRSGKRTHRR